MPQVDPWSPGVEPGGRSPPVAFVTGASSGLGRGLALRLAREGWAVGLAARRRDALESVVAEIGASGGRAAAFPCDVGERASVHEAAARCARTLGPVDLLVANAGVSENTFVRSFDAVAAEAILRVNFLGAIYAVEAVLPAMLERGRGQLVAVGSLVGLGGLPLSAAYSASKAALMDFFEALRVDLAGTGVAVTVIAPGYIRTPLTDRNAHPMPFLMDVDDAVDVMLRAIRSRRRLAMFPWQLAWPRWMAQVLPRGLYDRVMGRLRREKRPAP